MKPKPNQLQETANSLFGNAFKKPGEGITSPFDAPKPDSDKPQSLFGNIPTVGGQPSSLFDAP